MARPSRAGRTSLNRHRHVAGRRPSRLRGLESERRGSGIAPANFLEWVTTVAGATTLVGALLYYFGWARASTTFSYFGIEAEVLGLSFQDYLLRSVRSTYQPLLVVAGVTLGFLGTVALSYLWLMRRVSFEILDPTA